MKINPLSIFLIFITAISFILIYYRLNQPLSISKPSFFYFLIPVKFLILSIISLFLSKKNLFFLSYVLTVTICIAYSVEIFLRYIILPDVLKNRKDYFEKNNFDTRNIFEVLEELKEKKLDQTISVPPQNFLSSETKDILPLSGISKKLTVMCNESGEFNSYVADRYGFNNDDKIHDKEEIFSIFIGDSFTHGACVDNQKNLISNLQSKDFFKGKNILNLGYSGNGPLLSYATLKEYFNKNKNIKYVFWLYYEPNDLYELSREIEDSILKKYFNNFYYSQNLAFKQHKIDLIINQKIQNQIKQKNLYKKLDTNVSKVKLISFLSLDETRRYIFNLINRSQDKNIEIIDLFSKILKNSKNFSNKENFELVFIYLPGQKNNEFSKYYKDVLDIVKKEKIKLIDLSISSFYKENDFYPKYGSHFNEIGYEKLSTEIHNKLNQM